MPIFAKLESDLWLKLWLNEIVLMISTLTFPSMSISIDMLHEQTYIQKQISSTKRARPQFMIDARVPRKTMMKRMKRMKRRMKRMKRWTKTSKAPKNRCPESGEVSKALVHFHRELWEPIPIDQML
jgi:hypothetical protein